MHGHSFFLRDLQPFDLQPFANCCLPASGLAAAGLLVSAFSRLVCIGSGVRYLNPSINADGTIRPICDLTRLVVSFLWAGRDGIKFRVIGQCGIYACMRGVGARDETGIDMTT
jgi:hypothetical protein